MLRPDRLRHQHRAGRPFPAETESLQRPQHKKLRPVLGERTKKRAHGKPDNRHLQNAHSPVTVRQRSGDPSAQGRRHQRDTADRTGLRIIQAEGHDQRG